jgi:hypothetical protein
MSLALGTLFAFPALGLPELALAEATPFMTGATALQINILPVSCIYEYAGAGRIPRVRVGKHVRFSPSAVLTALSATGGVTGGHA